MKRNNNIFKVIILMFFLIAMLFAGTKAQAAFTDTGVWTADITQPKVVKPIEPTPTPVLIGTQAVEVAKSYLGTPYVWGGTTPKGFDCSGLVQYAYGQVGVNLSRTTYDQVKEGREVLKNELKEGDLIFFIKSNDVHHVGIYIGDGQFIHAPQTGDVVKITNLSERKDYYTARRIVE